MLVLKGKQTNKWEEVRKILRENQINFVDLDDEKNEDFSEVGDVHYELERKIIEQKNKKYMNEVGGLAGLIALKLGLKEESVKLMVKVGDPSDYEGDCTTEIDIEEKVVERFQIEEQTSYWLWEHITDSRYGYDSTLIEIDEEKEYEVKIPVLKNTYTFI